MQDEFAPALGGPIQAGVDRERAQPICLLGAEDVVGLFDRIVVIGLDFFHAHARRREPVWNVAIAEALNVHDDPAGSGSGGRARRGEGIADRDDARLAVAAGADAPRREGSPLVHVNPRP